MEVDMISFDSLFRLGASYMVRHGDHPHLHENHGKVCRKSTKKVDAKTEPVVAVDPFGSNTLFYDNKDFPQRYRKTITEHYDAAISYGLNVVRDHPTLALVSHTDSDHTRHLPEVIQRGAHPMVFGDVESDDKNFSWTQPETVSTFYVNTTMTKHGSVDGSNIGTTTMIEIGDGDHKIVSGFDVDFQSKVAVNTIVGAQPNMIIADGPFTNKSYKIFPQLKDRHNIDVYFEPTMIDPILNELDRRERSASKPKTLETIRIQRNVAINYFNGIARIEEILRNTSPDVFVLDHHLVRWGRARGVLNYLRGVAAERSAEVGKKIEVGTAAEVSPLPVRRYEALRREKKNGFRPNNIPLNLNPYTVQLRSADGLPPLKLPII